MEKRDEKWTWGEHNDARYFAYIRSVWFRLPFVICDFDGESNKDRHCMREQLIAEAWGLA